MGRSTHSTANRRAIRSFPEKVPMSTEGQHLEQIAITGITNPGWFSALVAETTELEHTALSAAVLSLRLHESVDLERRSNQTLNLLRRLSRNTDAVAQLTPCTFSLLLSPLATITEASSHIHAITDALGNAGLMVSAGFAHRRHGESLLDTWARAEAQADRASYRIENRDGLRLTQ